MSALAMSPRTIGVRAWLAGRLRRALEHGLHVATLGRGVRTAINGVPCRIDPRQRRWIRPAYEAEVADFLRRRVRPGQLVFDVGANVGAYVLQFAHWTGPSGRIVAFEPNPAARAALETHVAWNGLESRVEVVPHAVSASAGRETLYAADGDLITLGRLRKPNSWLAKPNVVVEVEVTTIDAFCRERGVVPDWIVMDIEGFELAALDGARETMAAPGGAPGVVVEMHPTEWAVAGTTRAGAEALLEALGVTAVPLTGQADPLGEYGVVHLRPGADGAP